MGRQVFISHSSVDKEIVSLFVDKILVAGCGISQSDIMFTSCEDMGIENGVDIPSDIKDGIKNCSLFIMMVSDNYRSSEVCLNEMGAAWITDSLKKCILLLPGVGFDKIGWLMSLKKADKLEDEEGLNHFHDFLVSFLGLSLMTGTWNKNRNEFLGQIQRLLADKSAVLQDATEEDKEDEEDLDLLTIRERFEKHLTAYVQSLAILTDSLNHYTDELTANTQKLTRYNENPKAFNASQVRGIFSAMAKETHHLSDINDEQTPQLKRHFDGFIKYGILLQRIDIAAETKKENEKEVRDLIDSIKDAHSEITVFKDSLDGMPDLDKSFTKAKNRLKKTLIALSSTLSFCVGRANEFLV